MRKSQLVRHTLLGSRIIGGIFTLLFAAILLVGMPALFDWLLGYGEPSLAHHLVGGLLMALGGGLSLFCADLFHRKGDGLQVPWDPPRRLVIRGPYCFIRNPMYLGNVVMLLGEAIFFASLGIWIYTGVFFVIVHLGVVLLEEPDLRRRHGKPYADYTRKVPRWLPWKGRAWPNPSALAEMDVQAASPLQRDARIDLVTQK